MSAIATHPSGWEAHVDRIEPTWPSMPKGGWAAYLVAPLPMHGGRFNLRHMGAGFFRTEDEARTYAQRLLDRRVNRTVEDERKSMRLLGFTPRRAS